LTDNGSKVQLDLLFSCSAVLMGRRTYAEGTMHSSSLRSVREALL
jgi:hypothetical protein